MEKAGLSADFLFYNTRVNVGRWTEIKRQVQEIYRRKMRKFANLLFRVMLTKHIRFRATNLGNPNYALFVRTL